MEESGGGTGGLDFGAFKAMIDADNPALLDKYAVEHYKLARELHDVAHDLDRGLGQLDEVFSSQHAAPALKARLLQSIGEMDNVGVRIENNSRLLEQAAHALRKAQYEVNKISEDAPDASPRAEVVHNQLSFEYGAIVPQLETFRDPFGGGDAPAKDGDDDRRADGGTAPGSGEAGAGGLLLPTSRTGSSTSPSGRFNPGPTLGGRSRPITGRGSTTSSAKASSSGRGQVGTGGANAVGGTRVGIPGARSGAPIGGYRPTTGVPGTGSGATPPGGSAQGKPGAPGGPGGPGAVPPGGTGPGQSGKDRPGRRLTNYEKLEPNVFRDTRHRVKPVIGEQRRQPDTFKPTPGAIGRKQAAEETPVLPELPTREAPTRFEGHDVSVSFTRRTRGRQ